MWRVLPPQDVVPMALAADALHHAALAREGGHRCVPPDFQLRLRRRLLAEALELGDIVEDADECTFWERPPLQQPPLLEKRRGHGDPGGLCGLEHPTAEVIGTGAGLPGLLAEGDTVLHPRHGRELELRGGALLLGDGQVQRPPQVFLGAVQVRTWRGGPRRAHAPPLGEEAHERVRSQDPSLDELVDGLPCRDRRDHRAAHRSVRRRARQLPRQPTLQGGALVDVPVLGHDRVHRKLLGDGAPVVLHDPPHHGHRLRGLGG
mmetsp:Transcript_615/g.1708  ORF Transcript_615/g.1708 Transcript_615/m.1708 type:complete len:262 (-) Transcript_615:234-1019(-)